ncbi:unnamed protein product, partial [Prorocentrum cordatum]
ARASRRMRRTRSPTPTATTWRKVANGRRRTSMESGGPSQGRTSRTSRPDTRSTSSRPAGSSAHSPCWAQAVGPRGHSGQASRR